MTRSSAEYSATFAVSHVWFFLSAKIGPNFAGWRGVALAERRRTVQTHAEVQPEFGQLFLDFV